MASLQTFPRAPRCLSCLRRAFLNDSTLPFSNPLRTQWRGKKKLPKRTTVQVRLLKDIAGYGRKGFIVPVAPGRMRNLWFPQGRAEYVTATDRKAQSAMVVDRDHSFNIVMTGEAEEDTNHVDIGSLSVSRAAEILERVVPNTIEFRRQPIQITPVAPNASSDPSSPPADGVSTKAIYGSVTTGDIAASIRAILSTSAAKSPESNSDALRVSVVSEDVKITGVSGLDHAGQISSDEDVAKIKNLGEWTIAIQIRGGASITRTIRVLPEVLSKDASTSNFADA